MASAKKLAMKPTRIAPPRLSLNRAVVRPLTAASLAAAVGGTSFATKVETRYPDCPKSGTGSATCPGDEN